MGMPLPLFTPMPPRCHTVPSSAFSSWSPGTAQNQLDAHLLARGSVVPAAVGYRTASCRGWHPNFLFYCLLGHSLKMAS